MLSSAQVTAFNRRGDLKHPRLHPLLCLLLLLPMLAVGVQAAADPLAGRKPLVQVKSQGCCAAKAAMAGRHGMAAAPCSCPVDAPCRVSTDPSLPAPEAALIVPAWPQAPAPTAGLPALRLAAAHPADLAAAPLPDPPPQERYLRLANLRI